MNTRDYEGDTAVTEAPKIGSKVRAITCTPAMQNVTIVIASIDREALPIPTPGGEGGWFVYGYRARRGARPRQTMYPRLYFVPRGEQ